MLIVIGRFIARLRREITFQSWVVRAAFRLQLGRWYIFRDAPLWVVAGIVANPPDEKDDALLIKFHGEAVAEVERRLAQAERTGTLRLEGE